jgi:hypothetical protein
MFSQQLKRLAGPALTVGGLFWIATYIVIVLIGLQTGQLAPPLDAHSPLLQRIGIYLLPLSLFPLYVGLLGVFTGLEKRGRVFGIIGVVFATLGIVLGAIDLVVLSGIFGSVQSLNANIGGTGAFSIVIGTGFIGFAALRARSLPQWMAWTLFIIGIITIPILFATPLPIGPNWATDFVAFLISGIGYTVVGVTLIVTRKQMVESTVGSSVNVVAQAK